MNELTLAAKKLAITLAAMSDTDKDVASMIKSKELRFNKTIYSPMHATKHVQDDKVYTADGRVYLHLSK